MWSGMVVVSSLLAIGLILLPFPKFVVFHPRQYMLSVIIYWLFDVAKGAVATYFVYLIGGWIAAYVASIVAVITSLFYLKCNTFAVAAGCTLVLSPILILIGLIVFGISLFVTRYYSLSAYLTIAAVILIGMAFVAHIAIWLTVLFLGVIVSIEHRKYFQRYKRGIEKQIEW